MNKKLNFDKIEEYLRTYGLDEGEFDFNGLLHLILIGIDNLRKHHIDADLESFSCGITNEQAFFMEKLLNFRKKFPDGDDT
jgi:hypothetical protein